MWHFVTPSQVWFNHRKCGMLQGRHKCGSIETPATCLAPLASPSSVRPPTIDQQQQIATVHNDSFIRSDQIIPGALRVFLVSQSRLRLAAGSRQTERDQGRCESGSGTKELSPRENRIRMTKGA
ncbi:hypothetical protein L1987_75130 [Smallanthus sonchifolius]|uniref:Uncharacterized protein n=1 Tax=Smallanthus sonchifolius TaxID=185202 RepID=A0ACB9A4L2_9ASTR|nr:hypothetical protein L1987_75130 [Smallanthus sonchifolius]